MTAIPTHASAAPPLERRADPSMEDVLASIRKIIADEDAALSRPPVDPVTPAPPPRAQPVTPPPVGPAPSASILTPSAAGTRTWGAALPPIPRPIQPPFGQSRPTPASTPASVVSPPVPAREAEPEPELVLRKEPAAEAVAPSVEDAPTLPAVPAPTDVGGLLSEATTDSISSAFEALTTSIALTRSDVIEKHVRDLLRPMLRTWLDDNLPSIVEKLVRLEIERVARGDR